MIIGEKVILRALEKQDIPKLFELHNNLEIKKQAMFNPFPISLEQDETWMGSINNDRSNKSVYFAIEEKKSNSFTGYTSLRNINWINRNCFFGITVLPSFQGKGLGKEATKLMVEYGLQYLNLCKIQLEVIVDNSRAIKLYKDLGFVEEGILKKHYYFKEFYFDVVLMAHFSNAKH